MCCAKLQVFACTFPASRTGGAPQKGGKLGLCWLSHSPLPTQSGVAAGRLGLLWQRLAPSCPGSSFRKSGEMGREELLTGFPKGPFDPKEAKKLPMFSYYLLTFKGRFIFSPNLFSVIQARGEFHFPHTHFLNIKFHFIKLQLFKKKKPSIFIRKIMLAFLS